MPAPYRIAFLSHLASTAAPTGAERSLALLAAGLARRGHAVTVVTPREGWVLAGVVTAAGGAVEMVPTRNAWLIWQGRRNPLYAAAKWALAARAARSGRDGLTAPLRRIAPDLVHVNCLPHVGGAAAARACGLPVVWHLREILDPGPRRRWFARRLRRDATRIVAVSEAVRAWVRVEGLDAACAVVPNGVAVPGAPRERAAARAALGLAADDTCLVGLFGQLVPHKGADHFLDAAAVAAREQPGLGFVVAGPGPDHFVAHVRRRAAAIPGAVLLPPQPDARDLVAAMDVVALTTVTADPFPRAVLEAMAAGRPVAAFDSGGTAEMVVQGETGLLCPRGDVAALTRAFVQLARDPALRERMGRAGRERALAEFTLERHLDRMEALFAGIARAASVPPQIG